MAPSDLPVFAVKVDKRTLINTRELAVPHSFFKKYLVDDRDKEAMVSVKGYPWTWDVKVKRGRGKGFVELTKGWEKFIEATINGHELVAYLVVEYDECMNFIIREFYDDNNVIVDIPRKKRRLADADVLSVYKGPGPEYLLHMPYDPDLTRINAHGPFYRGLQKQGTGKYTFQLRRRPWINGDVEVSVTNRSYITFGEGWKLFLHMSEIERDDLVHLELIVGESRIDVISFRLDKKGPKGSFTQTPIPGDYASSSSSLESS